MTRHRIAFISSIGPRIAAVAVAALTLGAASVASAQTAPSASPPPAPDGCAATPKVSCPEMPQGQPQVQTTTEAPIVPPSAPPQTSTTKTTSAEYTENAGAEKTTTAIRPNPVLLGTGTVLLVGPYVAGAIVAATNDHSYDDKLYIPVVGPWIDLGERPCNFGSNCSNADHWNSALLIGSGVAQAAGTVLMLTSFFVPAHHETTTVSAQNQKPQKAHVSVTPVSYKGGAGIGAVGTF